MIHIILHAFVIALSTIFIAKDTLHTHRSFLKATLVATATLTIMTLIYTKWGILLSFAAFLYYCNATAARAHHFKAIANYFVGLWALIALYNTCMYTGITFLYTLLPYTYVIVAYRHFNARYRDECGALTMALLSLAGIALAFLFISTIVSTVIGPILLRYYINPISALIMATLYIVLICIHYYLSYEKRLQDSVVAAGLPTFAYYTAYLLLCALIQYL
jgi:hypothetical protein